MYLIIGESNSLTNRIYAKLRARGEKVEFLSPSSFPLHMAIDYNHHTPVEGHIETHPNLPPIDLETVEGIYWWFYSGIGCPHGWGYHETETVLLNMFKQLDCRWVNDPQTIWNHTYKGYQLQQAQEQGALIPETLISNDAQEVAAFIDAQGGQVIKKHISDTGVPRAFTRDDLDNNQLVPGMVEPAFYQQLIEGTDVRVHVVDQCVYASEVFSQHLVSKIDIERPVRLELPDDVRTLCVELTRYFGLVLSGIDFRKTKDGQYYFLEANPSPQYPVYEDRNQYPISESLVEYLVTGKAVPA